jgi:hypothetical protein
MPVVRGKSAAPVRKAAGDGQPVAARPGGDDLPWVSIPRVVVGDRCTLGFLAFVLYVPGLREVFDFTYLHANDVLLALAAGATGIVWFELFKWVKGRKRAEASA